MPTQDEYEVSKQNYRQLYCKIELLNNKLETLYELNGEVVGEPTFSIDANSDIRRTLGISIYPKDVSFDIAKGNKIWIDKFIKVYIGIKNNKNGEIVYTNMGVYLIDAPQTTYSSTENLLTMSCLDLMAKLTGTRNGQLKGMSYIIPAGTNVRMAIIDTLELGGFDRNKQICMECPISNGYTPTDIEISSGGTLYGILNSLKEVYPSSQMYFDVDGIFHYEKIPNGDNEQIYATDDLWKKTLVGYTKETSFSDLKNIVEVYGVTHTIANFSVSTSIVDTNCYELDIPSLESFTSDTKVGFVIPKKINNENVYIKLKDGTDTTKYKLLEESYDENDGTIYVSPNLPEEDNTYCVAVFRSGKDYFTLQEISTEQSKVATLNASSNLFFIEDTSIEQLTNGYTISFKTPKSGCDYAFRPSISILLKDYAVSTSYMIDNYIRLENDKNYKATFYKNSDNKNLQYFEYMGEVTSSSASYENNPQSPFFLKSDISEKDTTFSKVSDTVYSLKTNSQYPQDEILEYYNNGTIGFVSNMEITNKNFTIKLYNNNTFVGNYNITNIQDEVINVNDNCYLYKNGNTLYKNNSPCEEIRGVFSGGEYEAISNNYLAKERADYELYLNCRLNDNVTITCVPIYWLDVNKVVEITLPNKNGEEKTELYIIKQVSTSFSVSGTQSVTLMKYYPTEGV